MRFKREMIIKRRMKIFLNNGHDSIAPLIEKIKEYLSKDAEGNLKREVKAANVS